MSHPGYYCIIMKRRNILVLMAGLPLVPVRLSSSTATRETISRDTGAVPGPHLQDWKMLPRYPINQSTDSVTRRMIAATHDQEPVTFSYAGGSSPGQIRMASIESVFHTGDPSRLHVSAYCHLRRQHRIFRIYRISNITS